MADQANIAKKGSCLFPTTKQTNLSHQFVVKTKPVVITVANMPEGHCLFIERALIKECDDPVWVPLRLSCCTVALNTKRNTMVLGLTGSYRAVILQEDGASAPSQDISEVVVTQHEAAVFEPLPTQCKCE